MEYFHHLYEQLDEFAKMCRKYDSLYIYGEAENQRLLTKYLKVCCDIDVIDFITSATLAEFTFDENTAVILGLSDKHYNQIFQTLAYRGFKNFIFLTEFAKIEISRKMRSKTASETVIEISVADHCNLNCCNCDHFSPISSKKFVDNAQFENDIKRLSNLTDKELGSIYLLGGEPLLNPHLSELLYIARRNLPNTKIVIYTNGLLLLNNQTDELWKSCNKNDATINLTQYPIKLDLQAILRKALSEGVNFEISRTSPFLFAAPADAVMHKYTLCKNGDAPLFPIVECYQFNHCAVLENGKIYTCPLSAHIDKFNHRYGETFTKNSFIDIYTAKTFNEISDFLSQPQIFCRYCNIAKRQTQKWSTSKLTSDEYL